MRMAKPKIFISYEYDNDKHYKNLLVAWDKNSEFDFSFYDESVDVSVDSTDAAPVRPAQSSGLETTSLPLILSFF